MQIPLENWVKFNDTQDGPLTNSMYLVNGRCIQSIVQSPVMSFHLPLILTVNMSQCPTAVVVCSSRLLYESFTYQSSECKPGNYDVVMRYLLTLQTTNIKKNKTWLTKYNMQVQTVDPINNKLEVFLQSTAPPSWSTYSCLYKTISEIYTVNMTFSSDLFTCSGSQRGKERKIKLLQKIHNDARRVH